MARIGVFVKNLTSGGAEKQASLLARFLSDCHDVTFIIFNAEKVDRKYLSVLDDKVKLVSFSGPLSSRWSALRKFFRDEPLDVLFSYLTAANAYACLGATSQTKVVTGLRNARLPLVKHMVDAMLTNRFAACTVTNCQSGKDYYSKHCFSGRKIEVIPNCIDRIEPYADKPASNIVKVITVGRFVAQKDYPTAIKTISMARQKAPQIRFTIIGYGKLEKKVRQLVFEYNIQDITEIIIDPSDIDRRLRNSDIYLSTSLFEGTSNSIMEGMNANLPIVATNVGDNALLVEEGVNGYLTAKGDINKLSSRIVELANNRDLRTIMGRKSKELLAENFSPEIFTKCYNKLIHRLI